jgi:SAM-dependent methyltransferase
MGHAHQAGNPLNVAPVAWTAYWEGLEGRLSIFRAQAEDYVRKLESAIALHPKTRVLDFGCGFGFVAEALASKVGEVFVWDSSANMLRQAQMNLAGQQNVRFLDLSNPQAVPHDVRFHLILVNSVVQYMTLDEFSAWLPRWRTMLAPGGRVVVSDLIPLDHHAVSDIADLLKFSVRRGVLWNEILWAIHKLGRYRGVRRQWPLSRIGLEELSRRGNVGGLSVSCLPGNLTHFTKRLTVIFTDAKQD